MRLIDYALAKKVTTGLSKMFAAAALRGDAQLHVPEQIRREPPSFQADIYSLGITCYELACGRQPFRANSSNELLNKHIREIPSPPTVYNKISPQNTPISYFG